MEENYTFGEVLSTARSFNDQLRSRLRSYVDIGEIGSPAKLPFKVSSVREVGLYKAVDITDGAMAMYDAGNAICAMTLSAAFLETAALLHVLAKGVAAVAEGEPTERLDEFCMRALHGTADHADICPPLDRVELLEFVSRTYEPFPAMYDQLTSFGQTTWEGGQATYSKLDTNAGRLMLGRDWGLTRMLDGVGFHDLALRIILNDYKTIDNAWPAFVAACEAAL